jgi:Tfp pilus assembly protein PilF
LECWGQIIKLDPECSEHYYERSEVNGTLERRKEQMQDLDKAIELDPQNYRALLWRGLIYQDDEEIEKCLQDYNQAIEATKGQKYYDFRAYDYRAGAYLKFGMYEQALLDYTKALMAAGNNFYDMESNMNAYRAYLFQGHTHMAMGNFQEAAEDYTKALGCTLLPDMKLRPHAFIKRAEAFEKLGELLHGKDDYEMALSLNPKESEASLAKERLAVVSKQIEDIIKDAERIRL